MFPHFPASSNTRIRVTLRALFPGRRPAGARLQRALNLRLLGRARDGTKEKSGKVKAVVYKGPNDVSVEDVPDAKIEHPADVLVRITATNICGSDLHMYEGRTSFEPGRTFGHENLGEVIETGPAVRKVQVGERAVLPFNIACGFCKNCDRGFTNY